MSILISSISSRDIGFLLIISLSAIVCVELGKLFFVGFGCELMVNVWNFSSLEGVVLFLPLVRVTFGDLSICDVKYLLLIRKFRFGVQVVVVTIWLTLKRSFRAISFTFLSSRY